MCHLLNSYMSSVSVSFATLLQSVPQYLLEMQGIEPRASYMQIMHSTTELHPLNVLRFF